MTYDPNDPFADDSPIEMPEEAKSKTRKKPRDLNTPFTTRFEKEGWTVGLVERVVPSRKFDPNLRVMVESGAATKVDLFGFADWVGFCRWLKGTTYLQVCVKGDICNRLKKATTEDASKLKSVVRDRAGKTTRKIPNQNRVAVLTDLLLAGNRFWIVGLEKGIKHWELTICDINLEVIQRIQRGEKMTVANLPKADYRKVTPPTQEKLI